MQAIKMKALRLEIQQGMHQASCPHLPKNDSGLVVVSAKNQERTEQRHTEQLSAVPTGYAHKFFLSSWVERKIWRNIIYFAIDNSPNIVTFIMLLKHRWGYAH